MTTWKPLAGGGALLLAGGVALFLAGGFVWTRDARHGAISPAVYAGAAIAVVGVVLLLAAAVVAWLQRPSS